MNNYRYYSEGNFNINYATETSFQCPNHENQDHINNGGFWHSGNYVRNSKELSRKTVDRNTTVIVTELMITKLAKSVKCNCPVCGSPIEFLGWRVWVENVKNKKIVGGMFQSGVKTVYTKYCKTLKTRKATVNRLLNKYR